MLLGLGFHVKSLSPFFKNFGGDLFFDILIVGLLIYIFMGQTHLCATFRIERVLVNSLLIRFAWGIQQQGETMYVCFLIKFVIFIGLQRAYRQGGILKLTYGRRGVGARKKGWDHFHEGSLHSRHHVKILIWQL